MKQTLLLFVLLTSTLFYCNNSVPDYVYHQPEYINDGLNVGSLSSVNIDSTVISKAVNKIYRGKYGELHSLLIFKDSLLVFEEYFRGHKYQWDAENYHGEEVEWNRDMLQYTMSGTKSFTSACIGIAIEEGFINNVEQSIFDYLPDHQQYKVDNREHITIEHLLTMSSGLAWDEWSALHGTSANDIDRLYFDCPDPIVCVLEKPWWNYPGQQFTYNGGGMVILAEIIKNASYMNIDSFSMKYLFEPLGIEASEWDQYSNGMYDAAGSLKLTPRSLMKFGVTYLNDGIWNGEQIISSHWVDKSSSPFNNNIGIDIPMDDSGENGYAYSWWTKEVDFSGSPIEMFRAEGWGDQSVMVFPSLDMVIVFTGGNYANRSSLFKLLDRYLLAAVED